MKRSITLAMAVLAAAALTGCGSDKFAQTSEQVAPVPGFSLDHKTNTTPPGIIGVRNAHLPYPGTDGYKAGSDAPVSLWLFNNTRFPMKVVITSPDATVKAPEIEIPPAGAVAPEVVLTGLRRDIDTASNIEAVIEFVGEHKMTIQLPVAPPDQPGPRITMEAPGEH